MAEVMLQSYAPSVEEVWRTGNRVIGGFLEGIPDDRKVRIRYEDLVSGREEPFQRLFDFLGIRFESRFLEHVFRSSIGKHAFTDIDPRIASLCRELESRMDAAYERQRAGQLAPPTQEASASSRR